MANGRSEQQQLDRLEDKVDKILVSVTEHRVYTRAELGRRPTRGETIGWLTLATVVVSGLLNLFM